MSKLHAMATLDGTIELGGTEVPEEVRKWIVSTFSRAEQDEKERKSEYPLRLRHLK